MDPKLREVTRIPLKVLWDENGVDLGVQRDRYVGAEDIRAFLRSGRPFPFVVATRKLKWIRGDERFAFWKNELQPHLAEPDWRGNESDWPNGYWYWATEWRGDGDDGPFCVLCEQYD